MKVFFCISLFFVAFFNAGCRKGNAGEENNCANINNARITCNTPLTIDQDLNFSVPEVGGYRIYDWRGPDNFTSQYADNSISRVQLKHEGWYRLHLYSLDGDCDKFDSVYVDVKLKQGAPPCTITNNTTTYNNQGTDSYTLIKKQIETSLSQKALLATGTGGANLSVIFHTRWRTAEPEDGIYVTSNTPLFDQVDNNYNKVFVTTTKSSIYWASAPDQTVYVSHVGTKLQVRFCNLSMSGSNGTSFTTIASGNLTEQ